MDRVVICEGDADVYDQISVVSRIIGEWAEDGMDSAIAKKKILEALGVENKTERKKR